MDIIDPDGIKEDICGIKETPPIIQQASHLALQYLVQVFGFPYLLVSRGARVRTGAGAKAIVPSLGAVHKIHQSHGNGNF